MSTLDLLRISEVRNIQQAELKLHPRLNLIYGENGSGKTSLLEALHLLASGKSFRTSKTGTLVREEASELSIYAETAAKRRVGVNRSKRQNIQLRLDLETQKNWDQVAWLLPMQVLDAGSFSLLEGGPKARRRFLDWGVFHVEHEFVNSWRTTRKCIANRNLLLKSSRLDEDQLRAWDNELSTAANLVDQARRKYFELFVPIFVEVYGSLTDDSLHKDLSLEYIRGWDMDLPLSDVLADSRHQDRKYGATQNGPHRADLLVKVGSASALDVLSRGQQKVLVSALKITQGRLYSQTVEDQCVYLVDDLPAELDQENRAKILATLLGLESQLFVTSVEPDSIKNSLLNDVQMATFHVERGIITA